MLRNVPRKYGIDLPDKQLVCAPVESPEGQAYLGAMRAAANFAWCNRQIMTYLARQAFAEVFEQPAERLEVMEIEFLLRTSSWERIVAPMISNLERLGVKATIRTVDQTQYQNRVQEYDYDAISVVQGQSHSPSRVGSGP